jgi:hypothetical protein
MRAPQLLLICGFAGIIAACSSGNQEEKQAFPSSIMQDIDAEATPERGSAESGDNGMTLQESLASILSSQAATVALSDSSRKMIRTANVKFRTKSVVLATLAIEDKVQHLNGFITHSNLTSEVSRQEIKEISADSSLEITYYTVSNSMTLRVPNFRFDTLLRSMATLTDFLDYRVIDARDVAIELLSNQLAQERQSLADYLRTKTLEDGSSPTKQVHESSASPLQRRIAADEAKLANLSLEDQIKYSTVNLEIYQRETIARTVVGNENDIREYRPGFGRQLLESVSSGWHILTGIVVFVVRFWGIILIIVIALIAYKIFGRKIRNREL